MHISDWRHHAEEAEAIETQERADEDADWESQWLAFNGRDVS